MRGGCWVVQWLGLSAVFCDHGPHFNLQTSTDTTCMSFSRVIICRAIVDYWIFVKSFKN